MKTPPGCVEAAMSRALRTRRGPVSVRVLGRHAGSAWWAALSKNGRLAASGGQDGLVKLWDVASGICLAQLAGHGKKWVNQVAFSSDGRWLASAGSDERINIWNVANRSWKLSISWPCYAFRSVAFHPSRPELAAGSDDGRVTLWNLTDGRPLRVLTGHKGLVKLVSYSATGELLASAGHDATAKIWNARDGGLLRTLEHPAPLECVSLSSSGDILAAGCRDSAIYLWDYSRSTLLGRLEGHTQRMDAVAFINRSRELISASLDGSMRIWDVARASQTALLRHKAAGRAAGVHSVETAADGRLLITSGLDGLIKVWQWL